MKKKTAWEFVNTLYKASRLRTERYMAAYPIVPKASFNPEPTEMKFTTSEHWCLRPAYPEAVEELVTAGIPREKLPVVLEAARRRWPPDFL